MTNIDGEIVETFDYGPYGELLSENVCGIIFLYGGELGVVTDGNGLYYMRARYYNPDIKRFINQDVVIGSITDSPTLNRYAYVNGNPISLNDPFGLSPLLNWLGGITGHDVLDVLGMLPGVGFVFDGINAIWYAAEGDYFSAACSFVSALPGIGDAFGAFSKAGKSCKLVTAFHKAGAAGNLILGSYTLGNIADKYLFGEDEITWDDVKKDLFTVAMTGVSMWGSAKDFGTSYCFVVGTLVTTEDGFKPIEEIQVGDRVLSEDETTGEVSVKTVTETYVNETDELVHIGVNGETISATPSHPFYVDKLGWTLARSLKAGDVLVLSNGELVTVEWVQHEILESPIYVYNFEVEDFHTYFVGKCGVLVHNMCEPALPLEDGLGTYGDQKGHHTMAKKAFEGVPGYDANMAVTVSRSKLDQFGVKHSAIIGQQHKLYNEFAASGQTFTLEVMRDIEIKAMTNAGIPSNYAMRAVTEAYNQLKLAGINPINIPWN